MNPDHPLFSWLWPALAALAGGLTALSFPQYRPLTPWGRMSVVFVGFCFAVFVGPMVVRWAFKGEPADSWEVGTVYYFMAVSAIVVLPRLVERLAQKADSTLGGLIKPESIGKDRP